jgi:RNA polymerase sigma-70 factor (ECF subfamily)
VGEASDARRRVRPAPGGLAALRALVAAMLPPGPPVLMAAGLGPAGLGPAELGPAGLGPAGLGPAGVGPAEVGPAVSWPGSPGAAGPAGVADPAGADPERLRLVALVDLARAGDTEAFAQLYDHYVDAVYRYVYYRIGSHAVAEDLTSETFLRALRAIGGFRWQGRDIGAWFTTIARNLIADHVKSSRFRLEVTTGDILDADRGDGGLEDAVLARIDNERLLAAVKQLTAEQQECIVLRFLQGLSVAETAEVMGRREGAVKQLQLRAVRALARLLAGDLAPDGGRV